jgi:hypothetical protein
MAYSDKDRQQLAELAKDPTKVPVVCDEHMYFGDITNRPTQGCPFCWKAYYFKQLADTPPAEHKRFMEELEAVVRQLVELEQKGILQKIQLYDHPDVKIEKNALPD